MHHEYLKSSLKQGFAMPFHSTKDFKMRKDILTFAPQQLEPVSILRQSWKNVNEFKRFENAIEVE